VRTGQLFHDLWQRFLRPGAANIRLGARVLRDYIKSTGTEVAGLQRYNGSTSDTGNAYATKVLGEKQRLQQSVARLRERGRA